MRFESSTLTGMLLTMVFACLFGPGINVYAQFDPSELESFLEIDQLPFLRNGIHTHQVISYDRAGDNYDFEYFQLYFEPDGQCVIFDAYGPGCLWRHHMNIFKPRTNERETLNSEDKSGADRNRWEGVNIRYYFDDETEPRIDMDVSTFFSHENPLGVFDEPFSYDGEDRFRVMYLPMFFHKRLRIMLSEEPGGPGSGEMPWMGMYHQIPNPRWHWFQYTYHSYSEDPGIESGVYPEVLKKYRDTWMDLGQDPKNIQGIDYTGGKINIGSGENVTIAKYGKKIRNGSIASIRLSFSPVTVETLFNTWIQITFDQAEKPQVNAPLGVFFGAYRSPLEINGSLLAGFRNDTSMYCYFPMPWWNSAEIKLKNDGREEIAMLKYEIGIQAQGSSGYKEDLCGYFHAVYNSASPRTEGHDYTCLEFTGRGHIVGHHIARWNTSMEENERTYMDGRLTPQIQGNGFEDDQNMGWGLKDISNPIFGAAGAHGGDGALYRFYIPDNYVFYSHVKHGHQVYGPGSPRGHEGMYKTGEEESVTFFYARAQPSLILTDSLDTGNGESESLHSYEVHGLTDERKCAYWYDGEFNNVLFSVPAIVDEGNYFEGYSQFTVAIDPQNKGVKLRRRINKQVNRQLAKVYVDEELVSERPWYSIDFEETYKLIRWYDTDFEIPEKYTHGKEQITIRIEHQKTPLDRKINEFYYWIYSYL